MVESAWSPQLVVLRPSDYPERALVRVRGLQYCPRACPSPLHCVYPHRAVPVVVRGVPAPVPVGADCCDDCRFNAAHLFAGAAVPNHAATPFGGFLSAQIRDRHREWHHVHAASICAQGHGLHLLREQGGQGPSIEPCGGALRSIAAVIICHGTARTGKCTERSRGGRSR